jgi:hypothetical protein
MLRILCLILFLLTIFLTTTTNATAIWMGTKQGSGDYSQYHFALNADNVANPGDKIHNKSNINLNITAWDKPDNGNPANAFKMDEDYLILLYKPGFTCATDVGIFKMSLLPMRFTARARPSSPNQLNFLVTPQKSLLPATLDISKTNFFCNLESGTYSINIWSTNSNTYIAEGLSLPVNAEAGGSDPRLEHVGPGRDIICKNKVTEVMAHNLTKGESYRLWWDGHVREYAWIGQASDKTMLISLGGGDNFFKEDENNYLCLAKGTTIFRPDIAPGGQCSVAAGNAFLPFLYPKDQSKCETPSETTSCEVKIDSAQLNTDKKRVSIIGTNFPQDTLEYRGDLWDKTNNTNKEFPDITSSDSGSVNVPLGELAAGSYGFYFYRKDNNERISCSNLDNFVVDDKVVTGNEAAEAVANIQQRTCKPGEDKDCTSSSGEKCTYQGKPGIKTAIGCVPTEPGMLLNGLLRYVSGFAGGIALLLMVFGSFRMITSAGNAEALKNGREQFVSAIIGLLFVLFSVLLMQIIGVDILGLPGFTSGRS